MFNFEQPQNPVLDAIEKTYDLVKDSLLKSHTFINNKTELSTITDFLSCTDEQAVILSILIQSQLNEGHCSIKEVLLHVNLKISHAIYINELLQPLVKREWLKPKKDATLFPLTEYLLSKKLITAVLLNKMEKWETLKIENSFQLLAEFQNVTHDRVNKRITYTQFIETTGALINNYKNIELAAFIIQSKMPVQDAAHFMFICLQYYSGVENFDCDSIIRDLEPSKDEQYQLRNTFKSGKNILFTAGLIKEGVSTDVFGGVTYFLTEKGVRTFDKNAVVKAKLLDGMFKHIEPVTIPEKKLFFEFKEKEMVNKLHRMIGKDNFNLLTQRLEKQGMKKGVTVLLYGLPGTGKTETVLQLGKTSNRFIMLADASKIRSKWVGETARNIKELFDEYRKTAKDLDETPILLFNEADALIGKRHDVADRGDQEMNTMQNILLEELENFEGIFIATTNLVDNIDKAFDRRFLYKIRFEKPGTETIFQIWRTKFPKVKPAILKNICSKVTLSGGQIENIRKKVTIDTILHEHFTVNEAYLMELAQQELLLENRIHLRHPIGFTRK